MSALRVASPIRSRLRDALEAGILLGVKWGIALAIMLMIVATAARDYWIVRERARNGQAAFEFILQQTQQPRSAPSPAPTAPPSPKPR